MKVRGIIKELEDAGWVQVRLTGSHCYFTHAVIESYVCVADHYGDDLPKGALGNSVKRAKD